MKESKEPEQELRRTWYDVELESLLEIFEDTMYSE